MKPSCPATAMGDLLVTSLGQVCVQGQSRATYIDVFQGHEVEGKPIALPDDGWPQLSTDSTGQHGAQPHGHRGHTDPLLRGEAELNHLCRGKGESHQVHSMGRTHSQVNGRSGFLQGRGPEACRLPGNRYSVLSKRTMDVLPGGRAMTYWKCSKGSVSQRS